MSILRFSKPFLPTAGRDRFWKLQKAPARSWDDLHAPETLRDTPGTLWDVLDVAGTVRGLLVPVESRLEAAKVQTVSSETSLFAILI